MWIKNNADWWSKGLLSDNEFTSGLAYLVKENIIQVDNVELDSGSITIKEDLMIPAWIKNNAGWWADGSITDDEFKLGIQYILNENIIQISNQVNSPNILVIMVDDLSVRMTQSMLENDLMPNLQKHVIERGTEFQKSFVTTPQCCPSRATFLTGQYAHNHGVLTNQDMLQLDDNHTLATWLHDAGYRTSLIGKYFNGYGERTAPTYIPPEWDRWYVLSEPTITLMYDYTINDNGILVTYGNEPQDYQTDVLATFASDFINQSHLVDDEMPFFLLVSTSAPHNERNSPSCYVNDNEIHAIQAPVRYAGTTQTIEFPISPAFNKRDVVNEHININPFTTEDIECIKKIYHSRIESMQAVDDLIGNVIQTLTDIQEFDNTVIIFTSDNGILLGEHQLVSKRSPFEETTNVPLYITAPNFRISQSSSQLVINNDLAPTILDLAKAKGDIIMDGRSLVPLFLNPNEENWRNQFIIERWLKFGSETDYPFEMPQWKSIRTSSHVFFEGETFVIGDKRYTGFIDFFDLEKDPYQLDSQINCTSFSCQEKIVELQMRIPDLRDCGEGTCKIFEDEQ